MTWPASGSTNRRQSCSCTGTPNGSSAWPPDPAAHPVWYLYKLLGLLLTIAGVSLGAPFWFDVLSKFIQIRGTGAKPKRTDEA